MTHQEKNDSKIFSSSSEKVIKEVVQTKPNKENQAEVLEDTNHSKSDKEENNKLKSLVEQMRVEINRLKQYKCSV